MTVMDGLSGVTVLWPRMLWLVALLPILAAAYFLATARHRRARSTLAALWGRGGSRQAGAAAELRHTLPPALFFLALLALLGAVARPQALVTLPSLHSDVILAIDTSGSMRATDVKPNRLAAAQDAARAFIDRQPRHSRIGIVSIAASASVVQSPTDNREDLMQALERFQLQQGTALGSGIYVALAALLPDAGIDIERLVDGRSAPYRSRRSPSAPARNAPGSSGTDRSVAIVLLSDGENNNGPDPTEAAKLAAAHGVRVYTVGIGTPEGITLGFKGWSMRVRLDEATLQKIAVTTRGRYYAASSAKDLTGIYDQLSARMAIEQSRSIEVTAFFVAAGALLLAISAVCSVFWFNRVL